MDPTTFRLISASAGAGVALPDIGTSMEGGYFAGAISSSANGVATHGLIVSPKASGSNGGTALNWSSAVSISGTTSDYDGAANTAAILTWLSGDPGRVAPAGAYCAGLSIGGYSDWYLPARFELEIAYFNLKPFQNIAKYFYDDNTSNLLAIGDMGATCCNAREWNKNFR